LVAFHLCLDKEAEMMKEGLDKVLHDWKMKTFTIDPQDEDIHSANERRLKVHSEILV
jgi:argininosuccinate lyase